MSSIQLEIYQLSTTIQSILFQAIQAANINTIFLHPSDSKAIQPRSKSKIKSSIDKAGGAAAVAKNKKENKYKKLSSDYVLLPLGF